MRAYSRITAAPVRLASAAAARCPYASVGCAAASRHAPRFRRTAGSSRLEPNRLRQIDEQDELRVGVLFPDAAHRVQQAPRAVDEHRQRPHMPYGDARWGDARRRHGARHRWPR